MPNKSQPFTLEKGSERGWTLSVLAAVTAVTSALVFRSDLEAMSRTF